MAEMTGTASITVAKQDFVHSACRKRGKRLQSLSDDRQIEVDRRWSRRCPRYEQTRLSQHTLHHAMVNAQPSRYGAHAQFISFVKA
jgi:hypothetical protein